MKQNGIKEPAGTTATESVKATVLSDRTKVVFVGGVYKADRLFFSVVKEEKWLNRMASCGYELVGRTLSGYLFEKNNLADNSYFSVSYTKVSSSGGELADLTAKDVELRKDRGDTFIDTYGTKIYYKTAKNNENSLLELDAVSKRKHAFCGLALWTSLLLLWLGLLCYNLIYWVRFNSMGVFAKFTDGNLNDYIVKEHSLWDITFDISSYVGNYPNAPHLSLFFMLTLFTIPFVALYFDLYMSTRNHEKLIKERLWSKK